MKKLLYTIILFGSLSFGQINTVVSIAPLKLFVDKIGEDRVESSIMVQAGASPHSYEPKASQMKAISNADIYFAIGVEFEKVWLDKFKNQNRNLIISDTSKGIEKIDSKDPHIWTSPINVKQIAKNIYHTLSTFDKNSSSFYKKNLDNYLKELDKLDSNIRETLKDTPKGSNFMVFHPAWGYFAKEYNLTELPVEIEGKEPKMRELIKLIKEAKKNRIQAIFTQPEFSDKSAKIIAKSLHIKVIKTSPLAQNWSENLQKLAKAIADKE